MFPATYIGRALVLLSLQNLLTARAFALPVTSKSLEPSGPPLLDVPVYSLATTDADGLTTGMNVLTYATPVSIAPDRLWSIGLYKGTVTHENFVATKRGVLQLLTSPHASVIRCLGGTSGRDVDKSKICSELGFPWISVEDEPCQLLPGCANYMVLECVELVEGGSHDVAICRVVRTETAVEDPKKDHLSTGILRGMGIITELGRVAEL